MFVLEQDNICCIYVFHCVTCEFYRKAAKRVEAVGLIRPCLVPTASVAAHLVLSVWGKLCFSRVLFAVRDQTDGPQT